MADGPGSGTGIVGRRVGGAAAAVVAAGVLAALCVSGLNHDVRYVLGGLHVTGAGGLSAAETFVHRPLAYRWLMAGLDAPAFGSLAVREAVLRFLVVVCVAGVALWLRRGLATRLPRREAGAVAGAVGVALIAAPAWDFLQPEWLAAVLATAAVGAALTARGRFLGAAPAGLLLALAVLMKYTTAPTALLGLGVVAVLDRRRALAAAAWALVATPAGPALATYVEPREWRWLREFSALNPESVMRTGFGSGQVRSLVLVLANEALLVPVVALLPVSVVVLMRTAGTPRAARAWPLLVGAGLAGVVAALVVQGQYFLYHLAAVVPLAAALWALAVVRHGVRAGRPVLPLLLATAGLGVAAPLTAARPLAWRTSHGIPVDAALCAVVAGTALWLVVVRPRGGRSAPPLLSRAAVPVAVFALAAAVPAWPTAPYSFDVRHAEYTALSRLHAREELQPQLAALQARIGARTPVVYLAFGDIGYQLGNPTHCRYPSPVFLQRTSYDRAVTRLTSFRENLRCLDDPAARYAVIDPAWFRIRSVAPAVTRALDRAFDCRPQVRLDAAGLRVCPRRSLNGA
ncbi:hypothetical protein AB0J38_31685 [Streptomyces sp. NPDC050095]|uniref:hypothetical protein n=1 Tax=unclassified Streptomyces TaxID=2593676 RepID=UPI00343E153D